MIEQRTNDSQVALKKQHSQFVMTAGSPVAQVNRMILHPRYKAHRRADVTSLLKHALGTLALLSALMMMMKF